MTKKIHNLIGLGFITLFLSSVALAQTSDQKILAASKDTSQEAFAEFLSQNKSYTAYADFQAKEHDSKSWQRLLVQAQSHFLQGSMAKALSLFKKIADSRFEKDWSPQHRERIVYSLFRLAQMSKKPKVKQSWIKKALEFSMLRTPSAQHFPPPIFNTWKELKQRNSLQNYVLPKNFPAFSTLKVNGQKVETLSGLIRTHAHPQRFSFYSNGFLPFHWVGRASDLENLHLPKKAVMTGPCRQSKEALPADVDGVLFPENCIKTDNETNLEAVIQSTSQSLSKKPKSFWKRNKTLLWVGAVVVSGIATWQYLEHQNPGAPQPQVRQSLAPTTQTVPQPIQITNQR